MINHDVIKKNLINLPQLVFEVTDACNLRCKYCGYASLYEGYDTRNNQKMSFEMAKRIIDYLADLWRASSSPHIVKPLAISFYGGEPLLNMPLVEDIVNYVKSLRDIGKAIYFNMTTNAMLLDRYFDFLVNNEFRILISLDGDFDGQGYRVDINGNNSFDRVIRNTKLLQTKYPQYFDRYVMFNSVLHNKNSVESIYYFIKNTFGKEPSISPLANSGIRPDKMNEFHQTYNDYQDSIESASDSELLKEDLFTRNPQTVNVLDYLQFKSGNVFLNYNSLIRSDRVPEAVVTGTCTPFSKKMFVTVNGKILQCEKISHEYALGRVTDDGVNLDLTEISQQYNFLTSKFNKQCQSCGNRHNCPQCVFMIDNLKSKSTLCNNYISNSQSTEIDNRALLYLRKHPHLYEKLMSNQIARR